MGKTTEIILNVGYKNILLFVHNINIYVLLYIVHTAHFYIIVLPLTYPEKYLPVWMQCKVSLTSHYC